MDSDSFDSSDNEPLSKYKKDQVPTDDGQVPSASLPMQEATAQRKRGRPKGPAKAPKRQLNKSTTISHHNICRDQIDEECECLGIYYRCWRPMNPDQTSHISVRVGNGKVVSALSDESLHAYRTAHIKALQVCAS